MTITTKSIDKAIASFTTNRNKLRDQAHDIAMMIVRHSAPVEAGAECQGFGDCTRALKLVQALPTSWGTQMIAWFKAFTPIRMNVGAGNIGYAPEYKKEKDAAKKLEAWDLESAYETPFFDLAPEPPVRDDTFNLATIVKMMEAAIKKTNKALEDGKVPDTDIEDVKAAAAMLAAIKIVPTPPASNDDRAGKSEKVA